MPRVIATAPKKLSTLAIAAKLRAGKNFWVGTVAERKAVALAARILGVKIKTQACYDGDRDGFNVYFLNK